MRGICQSAMIGRVRELKFIERDIWKRRRVVNVDHGVDFFYVGDGGNVLLFDRAGSGFGIVDGLFCSSL